MLSGNYPVHTFTREKTKGEFVYEGLAQLKSYDSSKKPITIVWQFETSFLAQTPGELPPEVQYFEGGVKRVMVNAYERNIEARRECIKHHGLNCAACGFNFKKIYGSIGETFIHVHHLYPDKLKSNQEYEIDPINDLIPVCASCHAMLRTSTPPLSIIDLKGKINQKFVRFLAE